MLELGDRGLGAGWRMTQLGWLKWDPVENLPAAQNSPVRTAVPLRSLTLQVTDECCVQSACDVG